MAARNEGKRFRWRAEFRMYEYYRKWRLAAASPTFPSYLSRDMRRVCNYTYMPRCAAPRRAVNGVTSNEM